MNDKSVTLVKEFAQKHSIVNTEGYVSFHMRNDFKGKNRPKVKIPEEKLDAIALSEGDDETIKNALLGELEIIN